MSEHWKTRVTAVKVPEVAPGDACMVMIYPPGPLMGKRFPLDEPVVYIGRGQDCEIQVDLDSVSRQHARVRSRGDVITVEDLKSTNGTYVNERQVKRASLEHGDLVQIGNTIFKFLHGGNVEADYHEAIYRMTIIDGLTGAHNKRFLMDYLEREVARCVRYRRPVSLVMFDLDHFKKINDRHGHLTGDHVLRELTRRVHARIRREELIARYGGEEFVVVLPEAGHRGALEFAEQLRQLVAAEPVEFEGDVIPVTISVGVSTIDGEPIEISNFLRLADENLYRAKHSGRNCVIG